MKIESDFLLAGGLNNNYVQASERGLYLARVPRNDKDLVQEWQLSIYPFVGFFQDGGRLQIRTPREQYDFSRRAAAAGLRVLAASELGCGTLSMPFLPDAQHLNTYLRSYPDDQPRIINQLFTDLRKAHASGFVYGDRWSPNILVTHQVQGPPEILHIDFDMEITGPTAKELEVAEIARCILEVGETTIEPLAKWLGTSRPWFDLDVVSKYLGNYAEHWQRDRFRITPGDLVESLLGNAYMLRDPALSGFEESHLAVSALRVPIIRDHSPIDRI